MLARQPPLPARARMTLKTRMVYSSSGDMHESQDAETRRRKKNRSFHSEFSHVPRQPLMSSPRPGVSAFIAPLPSRFFLASLASWRSSFCDSRPMPFAARRHTPAASSSFRPRGRRRSSPNDRLQISSALASPTRPIHLPAQHILLARDDRAVAQHGHPRVDPPARQPARRRHVRDRDVGDAAGVVAGADDRGAADGPQPLVVPCLHLRQVGRALNEQSAPAAAAGRGSACRSVTNVLRLSSTCRYASTPITARVRFGFIAGQVDRHDFRRCRASRRPASSETPTRSVST